MLLLEVVLTQGDYQVTNKFEGKETSHKPEEGEHGQDEDDAQDKEQDGTSDGHDDGLDDDHNNCGGSYKETERGASDAGKDDDGT